MNASKEECRKAITALEKGIGMDDPVSRAECLEKVNEFLMAAERKLPYETTFDRDKNRKDVEDAASKGFTEGLDPSESLGKPGKTSRL